MADLSSSSAEGKALPPTLLDAFWVWANIGILSFGGPAAQISLMHRVVVEEKKWLSEAQYLNALSFCMLLPGPEAMQLATYAGWRLHGVIGGMMAGLLFVIPGAVIVLILAMIYGAFGDVPLIDSLFLGIKAAVLVIVIEALLRVSKKALKNIEHWALATGAFIAIFFLALPYPLIVLLAALYGAFRLPCDEAPEGLPAARPRMVDSIKTTIICSLIWLMPLALLTLMLGEGQILSDIGWFFSKLAVVTFGGAYAVLAYMGQDVVTAHGWLTAGQMMDGLGLAETTPGPLILVTEFVGYLAAFQSGTGTNYALGIVGALVALWATFAPCFMWIFVGAPYIEWINHQPRLKGALAGITASVVGVILNLSLWFSLHVFFGDVDLVEKGIIQLWLPDLSTLNWDVVLISTLCGYLLLMRHWKIPTVLVISALLALLMSMIS